MSIATKSKYLVTGALAATLAFLPLFSGISAQSIAFAENDDAQPEVVESAENIENVDGDVATQAESTNNGTQLADWTYAENSGDNSVTLKAYNGTSKDVVIPGELNGEQVKINSFAMLKDKGITSLKVEETNGKKVVYDTQSMASAFYYSTVTSIDLSGLDTSNVTNMNRMFQSCYKLTDLDLSNFDTSNVTNMWGMFHGCSKLTDLDLSNFDTSKVTDMSFMFYNCAALPNIDVSNFNISQVENMSMMFSGCSSLTDLDVSNLNTSNVMNMSFMFENCSSLTRLDLSHFNTSNVTTMRRMFDRCSKLTDLDLSNFVTSKVTDMGFMFNRCESLTNIDVSNFDTSNVINMIHMFYASNL